MEAFPPAGLYTTRRESTVCASRPGPLVATSSGVVILLCSVSCCETNASCGLEELSRVVLNVCTLPPARTSA